MAALTSKAYSKLSSEKFTRELNKESLLNCYPIYTITWWSVLLIIGPAHVYALYSYLLHVYHVYTICPDIIFQILLLCSRPMTSHHVTCHVTAMSCASLSSKIKSKREKKAKLNKRKEKLSIFKEFQNIWDSILRHRDIYTK